MKLVNLAIFLFAFAAFELLVREVMVAQRGSATTRWMARTAFLIGRGWRSVHAVPLVIARVDRVGLRHARSAAALVFVAAAPARSASKSQGRLRDAESFLVLLPGEG